MKRVLWLVCLGAVGCTALRPLGERAEGGIGPMPDGGMMERPDFGGPPPRGEYFLVTNAFLPTATGGALPGAYDLDLNRINECGVTGAELDNGLGMREADAVLNVVLAPMLGRNAARALAAQPELPVLGIDMIDTRMDLYLGRPATGPFRTDGASGVVVDQPLVLESIGADTTAIFDVGTVLGLINSTRPMVFALPATSGMGPLPIALDGTLTIDLDPGAARGAIQGPVPLEALRRSLAGPDGDLGTGDDVRVGGGMTAQSFFQFVTSSADQQISSTGNVCDAASVYVQLELVRLSAVTRR